MNRSEEELVPIPNFPGYFVKPNGTVWSTRQKQPPYLNGKLHQLFGCLNKKGYLTICLPHPSKKGQYRSYPIHWLMLTTFAGPRPAGQGTRHLNGDQLDNSIANLQWGTQQENIADRTSHGNDPVGEKHPSAKLTEQDVRDIRFLRAAGYPLKTIARDFDISIPTVSAIATRRLWKHIEEED